MNGLNGRMRAVAGVASAFLTLAGTAIAAEVPQDKLTTEGDVLSSPPTRATANGIPSCAVAEKWTAYISAHDVDKVTALYAHDALVLGPAGGPEGMAQGSDEIRKFIGHAVAFLDAHAPAELVPVDFSGSGNECFFVFAYKWGNATNFHIGDVHHEILGEDGKIVRETVYVRPAVAALTTSAGVTK